MLAGEKSGDKSSEDDPILLRTNQRLEEIKQIEVEEYDKSIEEY